MPRETIRTRLCRHGTDVGALALDELMPAQEDQLRWLPLQQLNQRPGLPDEALIPTQPLSGTRGLFW